MANSKAAIRAPVSGGFNFRFAPVAGSRYTQKQADAMGPALLDICRRNEEPTYQHIIEHARDKNSPFHDVLLWDKDECMRQHHLTQVRHIARSINVLYDFRKGDEVKTSSVRAFHCIEILVEEAVLNEVDEAAASPAIPAGQQVADIRGTGTGRVVRKTILQDVLQVANCADSSEQIMDMCANYLRMFHERAVRYGESIEGFGSRFPAPMRREIKKYMERQQRRGQRNARRKVKAS